MANQLGYAEAVPWLEAGPRMAAFALSMIIGKMYTVGSKRAVFVFLYVNYLAGLALCGGTPSMTGAIVGRVWAGTSINGMKMGLFRLVGDVTPHGTRSLYQFATNLSWGIAFAVGPLFGMLGAPAWRWMFFGQMFLSVGIIPLMLIAIPFASTPTVNLSDENRIQHRYEDDEEGEEEDDHDPPDSIGTLLSVSSIILFTIATVFGGVMHEWGSTAVVLLYAIGFIFTVAFIIQQADCIFAKKDERHLDCSQFRKLQHALRFALITCSSVAAWVSLFYLPFYMYTIRDGSATETARDLVPFTASLVLGLACMDFLRLKPGYYRIFFIASMAFGLVGSVFMNQMGIESSKIGVYASSVLLGISSGSALHAGFTVYHPQQNPDTYTASIPTKLVGHLGGSWFGICVAGAIFMKTAKVDLRHTFPDLDGGARDNLVIGNAGKVIAGLRDSDRKVVLEILAGALQKMWFLPISAHALALVFAIMVKVVFFWGVGNWN
ncbi:hypothetical protein CP533_0031 [Ophiocordyceps camponoti-saundersi (nom. inval.)]|nr:hypothetical protein CP533_0031 [Ophiocordyceps camponoti-saundersi (nom. inval.)]